jgi:hypothetical protein
MLSLWQIKPQYILPLEASCNAHIGFAVTPLGTSVGHFVDSVQVGRQAAPPPCPICPSISSDPQGGFS